MVDDTFDWEDEMADELSPEERYILSDKGKKARQRARKKYDKKNPEERKRQKRDYMRRKRKKDKTAWR